MYQRNGQLIIHNGNEKIVIEAWGSNTIRVRAVAIGDIIDTHYALLDKPVANDPVIVIESKEIESRMGLMHQLQATLSIGDLTLKAVDQRSNIHLSIYRKGKLILDEPHANSQRLVSRHFKPIVGGDFGLKVHFLANEGEKLYGMGQYQQELLDIKGCVLELAHRNTQASVPFVLSSLGYGFFWHNPAVGRVSFGTNMTIWEAESSKQLDYLVFSGETPAEIVQAYVAATGLPPMMPEYGLGFWQCKLRYWNQEQILNIAREYHRRGIPLDVIVCDFFHWPYTGDFRFDYEFFPDPKAMTEELKSMGIKLMCSIWPQVDSRSENYREMSKLGLLIHTENGPNIAALGGDCVFQFIDTTNPNTCDYVWEKIKQNYIDLGVDLFWLDEAEPELDPYDFNNFRFYMGPDVQIGNIYPQRYSALFYDKQKEIGQEGIINLVRCAWAGSQRYGALVWSGDVHSTFEHFRMQLCAGLNMGISGIPWWTTDIGGFSGGDNNDPEFRELLVRWFQWSTFCPVMRLHGSRADATKPREQVVNAAGQNKTGSGADNEVWTWGEDICEILVDYINIRERMRDYSRAAMHASHETGAPVMRTLFYEFPEDAHTWELKDEYMYGSDLLIAPVMHYGMRTRDVYLPIGASWTDAWTGKVYEGGHTITVDCPIEQIPVFLRDGAQADLFVK